MNHLKKHKKEMQIQDDHWQSIADEKDIEKELEDKNMQKWVKQQLNTLPANYRSVLSLYYLDDKKYEDISDIMRIPEGTVATWISRGKKQLKKEFDKLELKGGK